MTHKEKLVNSLVSLSQKDNQDNVDTPIPDDELKAILKSYQDFLQKISP